MYWSGMSRRESLIFGGASACETLTRSNQGRRLVSSFTEERMGATFDVRKRHAICLLTGVLPVLS
jgi:hypothetical protein